MNNLTNVMNFLSNRNTRNTDLELLEELKSGKDTFFDTDKLTESLINDYRKYGKLIIAYDFDDTVFPSKPDYHCKNVVKLLQLCSRLSCTEMVCYTARSTEEMIDEVKKELNRLNIRYDAINDNVPRIKAEIEITCPSKVMFGVFLDNRAGLESAYKALVNFLDWLFDQNKMST